ncbi:MAG: aldehyde reductase [Pseudomonadales bacterium]|nr:aldehyde reductase [Pseudomonadales bacterium]
MAKVLVTGASGFIASHTIIELLNHGYSVRGTIRDPQRADALHEVIARHTNHADKLTFATASLTDPDSWQQAAEGCEGIFHIASPVPVEQPENADEIIIPAREGTLNVMRAAHKAGIQRVVLTSSVAAIMSNTKPEGEPQTAGDWTDLSLPRLTPYTQSKTHAEQAAWNAAAELGIELSTVNPALVVGPALEADYGSSLEVLMKLMKGEFPMLPRLGFGLVDVRDVASLHRIAFESPAATGQRLIASNGFRWLVDIAQYLRDEYPNYKDKIPKREMPDFLARLLALFDAAVASFVDDLGKRKEFDINPALALGWQPRTPEEGLKAGAQSLIELGLV